MVKPGEVVTVDFPGAKELKRRPAVVVSTDDYHSTRPDVILGLLTSQIAEAVGPTDYLLQGWSTVGLRSSSAFRAFLATLPVTAVTVIGHLSDRDWQGVRSCLSKAVSIL